MRPVVYVVFLFGSNNQWVSECLLPDFYFVLFVCPISCRAAVAAEGLRLQPLGRLRDGAHDEGETVLCGLQHRAGAEAGTGDHRAGGVLHGSDALFGFLPFVHPSIFSNCLLLHSGSWGSAAVSRSCHKGKEVMSQWPVHYRVTAAVFP